MCLKVFSKLRSLKEDWDAVRAPKEDDNLYYGLYERCGLAIQLICCYFFLRSDGSKIDESIVEMKDTNDYYE